MICVGDPHFKSSNKFDTDLLKNEIIRVVKETKPDLVVLMGDILDNGKSIYPQALHDATDFIYELADIVITYVLIGNHDMVNNQQYMTPVHPFTGIRNHSNVKIIWKLEQLYVPTLSSNFLFLPYLPPGRFSEALNDTDLSTVSALFTHQEYKGAALTSNGTKLSINGDVWSKDNPFVVSGHIHTHAWLQKNILYVGTPMQVDFGDISRKSISMLTITKTDKIPKEERIELNLRSRRIIHLSISEAYRWTEIGENIIWKIYIDGDASEVNIFLRSSKATWFENNGIIIFSGNTTHRSSKPMDTNMNVESYKDILFMKIKSNIGQQQWLTKILQKM